MRKVDGSGTGGGQPDRSASMPSAGDIEEGIDRLRDDPGDVTDAERIDQIGRLERLKSAAASAQARLTADFDTSQRADQESAGVPARRVGAGVAAQVAWPGASTRCEASNTWAWPRC